MYCTDPDINTTTSNNNSNKNNSNNNNNIIIIIIIAIKSEMRIELLFLQDMPYFVQKCDLSKPTTYISDQIIF
jgi:hypothetical protein